MKKINENAKVTLTIGQLKKLVKESYDSDKGERIFSGFSKCERVFALGDEGEGVHIFGANSADGLANVFAETMDENEAREFADWLWDFDLGDAGLGDLPGFATGHWVRIR